LQKLKSGPVFSTNCKQTFDFWGTEALDESCFPEVSGLKTAAVDTFRSSLSPLAKKLLRCFAIHLSLEDMDYFIKQHRALYDPSIESHTNIRSNFYHPFLSKGQSAQGVEDSAAMRAGEHFLVSR